MIKRCRKIHAKNTRQLRRARNLYKRLISSCIIKNPELSYLAAVRAIESGLYSFNTPLKQVVFSLWRGAWKHKIEGLSWHGFCSEINDPWWASSCYYTKGVKGYRQIKKLRVRVKSLSQIDN